MPKFCGSADPPSHFSRRLNSGGGRAPADQRHRDWLGRARCDWDGRLSSPRVLRAGAQHRNLPLLMPPSRSAAPTSHFERRPKQVRGEEGSADSPAVCRHCCRQVDTDAVAGFMNSTVGGRADNAVLLYKPYDEPRVVRLCPLLCVSTAFVGLDTALCLVFSLPCLAKTPPLPCVSAGAGPAAGPAADRRSRRVRRDRVRRAIGRHTDFYLPGTHFFSLPSSSPLLSRSYPVFSPTSLHSPLSPTHRISTPLFKCGGIPQHSAAVSLSG